MKRRTNRLARALIMGRHLKRIRDAGLADGIGGFTEWAASIGYSRFHADRLIRLYERVGGVHG